MRSFRRSVFRLLLATCFLLFVAWVSLKLMQYRGNVDALLADGRRLLDGWGEKLRGLAEPALEAIRPKVEELLQSARDLVGVE